MKGEGILDISKVDRLIENYKGREGTLIATLEEIQEIYGYLPREALLRVASERGLSPAEIYGIVTFYSLFKLSPCGKYIIKVCHGTACHVTGAERITDAISNTLGIGDGETTEDNMFTLEKVACLGCCSLAPCIMVGDKVYGKLTADKAKKIIKGIADGKG